jgi:hypothetical protein
MADLETEQLYRQIERRYGFALPPDYRMMRGRGWFDFDPAKDGNVAFDPVGCRYLWLNEMEWMPLQAIRDFAFPDYCLDGFVPFAFTGGGDLWCWHPPSSAGDNVPVVLCPRDSNMAEFYAPHFLASLYRQVLDYARGPFAHADEGLAHSHLSRWAADLGPLLPPPWRVTLGRLQGAELRPWQRNGRTFRTLLPDEEYRAIVRRDLHFPNLDRKFKWTQD